MTKNSIIKTKKAIVSMRDNGSGYEEASSFILNLLKNGRIDVEEFENLNIYTEGVFNIFK